MMLPAQTPPLPDSRLSCWSEDVPLASPSRGPSLRIVSLVPSLGIVSLGPLLGIILLGASLCIVSLGRLLGIVLLGASLGIVSLGFLDTEPFILPGSQRKLRPSP